VINGHVDTDALIVQGEMIVMNHSESGINVFSESLVLH
jgi:hypothetical protein